MKRKTLENMNKEVLLFGLSPMVVSIIFLFLVVVLLASQVIALMLVAPLIVLFVFLRKLTKKGNTDLINSFFISSGCPDSIEDNKNIFRFLITEKVQSDENEGTD